MRLFNTQSGSVETVISRSGPLGVYVCGVTPYDTTHAGHAFTYLAFDVLIRYLRYTGQQVRYVQNVTDIDDDILRKAGELGVPWNELGERETARFLQDMADLNWAPPDHYVRATDHIPEMIDLIEPLIDQQFAYVSNGNVYFSVASDPDFGKLSHLSLAEMLPIANERGNTPDDPYKRDPLDFVLWQKSKPGEPAWASLWSDGRPGWHIECSAMATRYLGPSVDIHGGGSDLIFPHHECEIAQTENATGVVPFVRHWMHVGMVEYEGEKMSKSLGNLVLVSDVLKRYSADAFRLYAFSHHYRFAWEYRDAEMDRWAAVADELRTAASSGSMATGTPIDVSPFRSRFLNAMEACLDTPAAIMALIEIGKAISASDDRSDTSEAQATLRELGGLLGLQL